MSSDASDWFEKLDLRDACDKFEAMERRFGAGGDDGRSFEWEERRPCRSMRWLKREGERDYESSGRDGDEEREKWNRNSRQRGVEIDARIGVGGILVFYFNFELVRIGQVF